VTFTDQRLLPVAQMARDLIAADCPGLAAAVRPELADAVVDGDVRRIRFTLARPGELPELAPVLGVDTAGPAATRATG